MSISLHWNLQGEAVKTENENFAQPLWKVALGKGYPKSDTQNILFLLIQKCTRAICNTPNIFPEIVMTMSIYRRHFVFLSQINWPVLLLSGPGKNSNKTAAGKDDPDDDDEEDDDAIRVIDEDAVRGVIADSKI